jgi:hypothetical protein
MFQTDCNLGAKSAWRAPVWLDDCLVIRKVQLFHVVAVQGQDWQEPIGITLELKPTLSIAALSRRHRWSLRK